MLYNFSYVIDKVLAGSAKPGTWSPLPEDLQEARDMGITAIVSLTELPLPEPMIREAGLGYLHLPVEDFTPPTIEQVEKFVEFVDKERDLGGAVLAHCFAGQGRTGTMLAAYLVKEGRAPDRAVEEVRSQRPGSIESRTQLDLVHRYAARLRKAK